MVASAFSICDEGRKFHCANEMRLALLLTFIFDHQLNIGVNVVYCSQTNLS